MSQLPPSLIKDLRRKTVIPFIGAGVSRSVLREWDDGTTAPAFPTWAELLRAASERLEEEGKKPYALVVRGLLQMSPPRYLQAAEFASEGLGPLWYSFLRERLDVPRRGIASSSLDLPSAIWQLNDFIITTNYDRVLRWTCPAGDMLQEWNIEVPGGFVQYMRGELEQPAVWYLHGSIDNVTDVILTPGGYGHLYPPAAAAADRYQAALATLRTLLVSRTFLFIGFSLDDEHFSDQLRWIKTTFANTAGPHYLLMRRADVSQARAHLQDLNVEVIEFAEFGEPLVEAVKLMRRERDERDTASTLQRPRLLHNLPRLHVGSFVGRQTELQEVIGLLERERFVMIGGNSGVGKTTLALQAAHSVAEQGARGTGAFDTVVWVSAKTTVLEPGGPAPREQSVTRLQSLLSEIARVLGRPGLQDRQHIPVGEIYAAMGQRRVLLVVDNFETVEDDAIRPFLDELPGSVTVLLTSRLVGDFRRPYQVGELLPESAEALIRSECRERQVDPTIDLVAQLHAFAGGNPLALVWAVSNVALGFRPDLPTEGAPPVDLVEFLFGEQLKALEHFPDSQQLLRCLALFPAGADAADLLKVARAGTDESPLRLLRHLSLVEWRGTHVRMLPVTKRLLLPQLQNGLPLGMASVQYDIARVILEFLQREETAISEVGSHRSTWALQRENVLWALEYGRERADEALECSLLCAAYWPMLMHGGLAAYAEMVERHLAGHRWTDPSSVATVTARAASVHAHLGNLEQAQALLEEARTAAATLPAVEPSLQNMLNFVATVIAVEAGHDDADEIVDRALRFEEDRALVWTRVGFIGWKSLLRCRQERWGEAEGLARQALQLAHEQNLSRSITFVSVPLAMALRAQGGLLEARRVCDDALALADEYAEMHNFAHLCLERGRIAVALGEPVEARALFSKAHDLYAGLGVARGAEQAQQELSIAPFA